MPIKKYFFKYTFLKEQRVQNILSGIVSFSLLVCLITFFVVPVSSAFADENSKAVNSNKETTQGSTGATDDTAVDTKVKEPNLSLSAESTISENLESEDKVENVPTEETVSTDVAVSEALPNSDSKNTETLTEELKNTSFPEGVEYVPSRLELVTPERPVTKPLEPQKPLPPPQEYPEESFEGLAEDLNILATEEVEFDEGQPEPEKLEPKIPSIRPLFIPSPAKDVLSRADYSLDKNVGKPIDLPYLLSRILKNHPSLEISSTYILERKGDYMVSESLGAVKVDTNASLGPKWTSYPETKEPTTLNWGSASVSVSQTFYDFGAIRKNLLSSQYSIEAAEVNLRKAIDDIAFTITMFYLDVLQAQEVVHIRRKEVSFYESLKKAYDLRYTAGESSLSDVQKMDVSLRTAESNLVAALQNLRMAKDVLETLLEEDSSGLFEVYAPLFIKTINAPLDELLTVSEKVSYSIESIKKEILSAQTKISSLESDRLPKIGYNVSAALDGERYDTNVNYGAQLTLSWTPIDGNEKEGQIVKIRALLRRHKASLRSTIYQMTDRIKGAYNNYQASTRELELARAAKDMSIKLTNNYFHEIDLGIRTLLDLVSAKEGEVQAELRESNSRFKRVKALLQLYLEVGLIGNCIPISDEEVHSIIKSFGITPNTVRLTSYEKSFLTY